MKSNAYRDENADAYWRRRVFILAGGMVILGLLAWALSGSGGSRPTATARQAALAQVRAANGLPAAAYASSSPTPPVTPAAAAVAAPGSPSASASPGPSAASASASSSPRKALARAASTPRPRPNASCPAGSVVMTLFTTKPSYASAERPVFEVYAVSTSASECAFRFGPGVVHVLVSQRGRVVWNSAECRPAATNEVRMQRGVPAEMSVTWNRHAPYGCRGWLVGHPTGRFTATARSGAQSSPATDFELVP